MSHVINISSITYQTEVFDTIEIDGKIELIDNRPTNFELNVDDDFLNNQNLDQQIISLLESNLGHKINGFSAQIIRAD